MKLKVKIASFVLAFALVAGSFIGVKAAYEYYSSTVSINSGSFLLGSSRSYTGNYYRLQLQSTYRELWPGANPSTYNRVVVGITSKPNIFGNYTTYCETDFAVDDSNVITDAFIGYASSGNRCYKFTTSNGSLNYFAFNANVKMYSTN